jgi:hypothetical protein
LRFETLLGHFSGELVVSDFCLCFLEELLGQALKFSFKSVLGVRNAQ